jgi:hypothetical protein
VIDASAVNAIAELARQAAGQTVTLNGVEYSTTPLHDLRKPLPEPAPLVVHTLTGLHAYIVENRDELDMSDKMLHVVEPWRVQLVGALTGRFEQRFVYAEAHIFDRFAAMPHFAFSRWLPAEDMIIAVQALFEDVADRAALLRLLGNIRDEAVQTKQDDGITQRVTARTGIATVENVEVPNPVVLAPLRTFPEIAQPQSPFIFRLRKGSSGIEAALFEADGGAWRLAALHSVADWLGERLNGIALLA